MNDSPSVEQIPMLPCNNPFKDDAQKKKQNQELRELRELNTKQSKDLATKNREIEQLKIKIDKLEREINNGKGGAQEEEGNFKRGKRQAQIEEPSAQNVQLVKTEKSKATAELLKNALKECDLLRRLEISHIEGIVYLKFILSSLQ